MTDGWNIEGSPHNRAIWQHNIAIARDCPDYVVRNLLLWNTRSVFISNQYNRVLESLKNAGFLAVAKDNEKAILFNPTPSSYFMLPERNALAIGLAAQGLVMSFPWLIQGRSPCLEDYCPEDLARFRLIYLVEPQVRDFGRFKEMVAGLAGAGKKVIVEMGRAKTWPLFDTIPYWEKIMPGATLVPTKDSLFTGNISLDADPNGQAPAMGNLDGVWLEMINDATRAPVIGYKNVEGNKVYFVGLALGQQLNSSHGREIRTFLEQLMDIARPYKNIVPNMFPVSDAQWGHSGFSFRYNSESSSPVWISVTYTPRWKASVDGSPLSVRNLENLILLDLPPGKHVVSLHYGMTWVGWMGIVMSIFSLMLVIFVYLKFDYITDFWYSVQIKIKMLIESIGT